LAAEAKRTKLLNGTAPSGILLPEADLSDMEFFIAQARIVLGVLGVNILRLTAVTSLPQATVASDSVVEVSLQSPVFEMTLKGEGLKARAREIDGEFVVLAGSQARASWIGVTNHGYRKLREQVEQEGILTIGHGGGLVFEHDRAFDSPSAAAAVVSGRTANGRSEWKLPGSGVTFGEWQAQAVESTAAQMTAPPTSG
jgi:Domain of unknown function (DUF4357)